MASLISKKSVSVITFVTFILVATINSLAIRRRIGTFSSIGGNLLRGAIRTNDSRVVRALQLTCETASDAIARETSSISAMDDVPNRACFTFSRVSVNDFITVGRVIDALRLVIRVNSSSSTGEAFSNVT